MITRIGHGAVLISKSDEYRDLMRSIAVPKYGATPGNKGAYALRRIDGKLAHFLMVSFWESAAAIRAFAGDDITAAKFYEFDKTSRSKWSRTLHTTRRRELINFVAFSTNSCDTLPKW